MFDINKFIMDTLKGMKGNYPDFQIREYALNWYSKGKITEENLAELETFLTPVIDETEEEITEEGIIEDVTEEQPVDDETKEPVTEEETDIALGGTV